MSDYSHFIFTMSRRPAANCTAPVKEFFLLTQLRLDVVDVTRKTDHSNVTMQMDTARRALHDCTSYKRRCVMLYFMYGTALCIMSLWSTHVQQNMVCCRTTGRCQYIGLSWVEWVRSYVPFDKYFQSPVVPGNRLQWPNSLVDWLYLTADFRSITTFYFNFLNVSVYLSWEARQLQGRDIASSSTKQPGSSKNLHSLAISTVNVTATESGQR